jgi:hypothetical protein
LILARQSQHLVRHVESIGLAARSDAPSGEQNVDAPAGSEIEHDVAFLQIGERSRIATAE